MCRSRNASEDWILNMHIETVQLKNFKRFELLKLDFDPNLNIFIGVNGAGKTSILQSLLYGLATTVHYFSGQWGPFAKDAPIVHKRIERCNDRVRQEAIYPVEIILSVNENDEVWRAGQLCRSDNSWELLDLPSSFKRQKELGCTLPVFAFYAADRFMEGFSYQAIQANFQPEERLTAYQKWNNASDKTECQKTLSWVVTKSMERMQLALERSSSFHGVVDDDLATLNHALKSSFDNFDSIYYDWNIKAILTRWTDDGIKPFEDLSDGQRAVVFLFADIVRRAALLNPHLGTKAAQETDGIVIIDELDAHLHPAWQQKIAQGLQSAFPKMQFIVSTHSPFVAAEVKAEQIYLLKGNEVVHPRQALGLNNSEINLQIFETTGQNDTVAKEIQGLRRLIDVQKFDAVRQGIEALEQKLNGPTEDTRELAMLLDWAKSESEL